MGGMHVVHVSISEYVYMIHLLITRGSTLHTKVQALIFYRYMTYHMVLLIQSLTLADALSRCVHGAISICRCDS